MARLELTVTDGIEIGLTVGPNVQRSIDRLRRIADALEDLQRRDPQPPPDAVLNAIIAGFSAV